MTFDYPILTLILIQTFSLFIAYSYSQIPIHNDNTNVHHINNSFSYFMNIDYPLTQTFSLAPLLPFRPPAAPAGPSHLWRRGRVPSSSALLPMRPPQRWAGAPRTERPVSAVSFTTVFVLLNLDSCEYKCQIHRSIKIIDASFFASLLRL